MIACLRSVGRTPFARLDENLYVYLELFAVKIRVGANVVVVDYEFNLEPEASTPIDRPPGNLNKIG